MLEENPWRSNPRRKRRRNMSRNPMKMLAMPKSLKSWSQGVDLTDAAAGGASLIVTGLVPGAIIKSTPTMFKKIMKLAVAVGVAMVAGTVAKGALGANAGKAAVIGGLAGVVTQALAIAGVKFGEGSGGVRRLATSMRANNDKVIIG